MQPLPLTPLHDKPGAPAPWRRLLHDAWRQARGALAQNRIDEWRCFVRAWRASPRGVGALAPSSAALARAMAAAVRPGSGPVLDLGSGTGVFARELCRRGVTPAQLTLVERDAVLAEHLRRSLPDATVLQGDAAGLGAHSVWRQVGDAPHTILCGLPLLNMSVRQRIRVMRGAFGVLARGGSLVLFTYGVAAPLKPSLLAHLGLKAVRIRSVAANLPPAHLWRISRRASGEAP